MALVLLYEDHRPDLASSSWLAPNATVIGNVEIAEVVGIWFGAVIRGDGAKIKIGAGSNIQDCCVLHTDPGHPLTLGADVAVGHGAVLHGCTIEDGVLIGMGAVVMNGANVGSGSVIAAGSVVLSGTEIPERSLVAGLPATVRRGTTDAEVAAIASNVSGYRERAQRYARQVADLVEHRSEPRSW